MFPSGSGNNDIDLQFNPESILANAMKVKKAFDDVAKGVEGSAERANSVLTSFSEQIIKVSDRSARSQERQVRSLEAMASAAGKSGVDRLIAQRDSLIKRLGDEEKLVDRVRMAYDKLIKAEQGRGGAHGHGPLADLLTGTSPLSLAARGARDLFEGRTAYGEMMIVQSLSKLGGAPMIIGGITAALVGLTAAGVEAAKSMAEFGDEVKDASARTGLSIVEVQRFALAARASGTDLNTIEQSMRGLTQAIEDNSAAGDRARAWLIKFGVDVRGVREGTVSTGEVFKQFAEGWNKLPTFIERSKAGMDVFKRAWLELAPMMAELPERLERYEKGGVGMDEGFVNRADQFKGDLAELSQLWKQFKLQTMEPLTVPVRLLISWLLSGDNSGGGGEKAPSIGTGIGAIFSGAAGAAGMVRQYIKDNVGGMTRPEVLRKDELEMQDRLMKEGARKEQAKIELDEKNARTRADLQGYFNRQGLEGQLRQAQQRLTALPEINMDTSTIAQRQEREKAEGEVRRLQDAVKRTNEQKQFVEQLNEVTRRADDRQLSGADAIMGKYDNLIQKLHELRFAHQANAQYESQINAARIQELEVYNRLQDEQLAKQLRASETAHSFAMLRIQQQRELAPPARTLGQNGVTESDLRQDVQAQFDARIRNARQTRDTAVDRVNEDLLTGQLQTRERIVALAQIEERFTQEAGEANLAREKAIADIKQRSLELEQRTVLEISQIRQGVKEDDLKRAADLTLRRIELSTTPGTDPTSTIAQEAAVRKQLAQELYNSEEQRIALRETGWQAERSHERNLADLRNSSADAQQQAEVKLMELQRSRLEELKSGTESALHNLFTDPGSFLKNVGTKIRDSLLRPLESGMADVLSKIAYKPVFGQEGTGGIAGALRDVWGKVSGTASQSGLNSVRLVNGAVPVTIMGGVGVDGSTGGVGGSGGGLGGWGVGGGGTATAMNLPANIRGMIPGLGIPGLGGLLGPGGTGGFAGPLGTGPGATATGAGGNGIGGGYGGMIPGGGAGGAGGPGGSGGFGGLFSSAGLTALASTGLIAGGSGLIQSGINRRSPFSLAAGGGMLGAGIGLAGGPIGALGGLGVGLFAGGMMKGGWGGVAMTTLGGAAVGAQIGTTIFPGLGTAVGAGLGAAIGFGAGLARKLFGGEDDITKVKKMVRDTYRVDIQTHVAKQIVQLAKEKYADNLGTAVRSPEVRQMLGIYSAGTGQAGSFPMSASTPFGASLVNSGGQLMQQAVYQYGNPYTYSSNLPVYGGGATGHLPGPTGPTMISLNISGNSAAKFMSGEFVNPEAIQDNFAEAQRRSAGRLGNSMVLQQPGTIVA